VAIKQFFFSGREGNLVTSLTEAVGDFVMTGISALSSCQWFDAVDWLSWKVSSLNKPTSIISIKGSVLGNCLYYIDTVGWASGRASGL